MEELQISSTTDMGKYLGLPSMRRRSKKEAFKYLKDKVFGWMSKTLNHARKEVLIIEVMTTIPMNAMSVFIPPKPWCSEVSSIITDFWRDELTKGKKIQWK